MPLIKMSTQMKSKNKVFLGIDTSCYTTSCALIDSNFKIIQEERKLLDVKEGARGLSQSNMVFQHSRALPILLEKLPKLPIVGIGVSSFPRRKENSYMPAFLVGKGFAKSLAHFLDCKLYEFSHQENHILAALRELGYIPKSPFYSLHVSGGTTELLYSEPISNGLFTTELVGGSSDLNAGQFIDRVGVALGLPFPSGPFLEKLAFKGDVCNKLKISLINGQISYGGPETAIQRILKNEVFNANNIAAEVFECVGRGLIKLITYHTEKKTSNLLIAVGGVMSNALLRTTLKEHCDKLNINIIFTTPKYSSDNATGNAFGAALLDKQRK